MTYLINNILINYFLLNRISLKRIIYFPPVVWSPIVRKTEKKNYNIDEIIDAAIEKTNYKCGGGLSFQPMLAEKYDGTQNIENWLMSEKLDGIRCIWDGQRLYSRNGKLFHPPKWFKEGFPSDIVLDGELFLNRKDFSRTSSIVMKQY